MGKNKTKIKEKKIFNLSVIILILLGLVFIFFKVSIISIQGKIKQNKNSLIQQEQQLAAHESATSYDKFLLISNLEEKVTEMPWFEHIPKILQIFQDLKSLNSDSTDIITLSDFEVSLDEINLKGSVSSLKALYYNSPSGSFKALLERFEELDFIKNIKIGSYNRTLENNYFEFILNAKVINNDTK